MWCDGIRQNSKKVRWDSCIYLFIKFGTNQKSCKNTKSVIKQRHIILWYTPSAAPNLSTSLKPILFMARDSSSGFRQEHHTFLYGHKKYNRGSGRKRTNEQYGLRSAPSARRVVLWHFFVLLFVHLVDSHWVCIFREISTKLLGMPTHLDWSSLSASFCWPLSIQDC